MFNLGHDQPLLQVVQKKKMVACLATPAAIKSEHQQVRVELPIVHFEAAGREVSTAVSSHDVFLGCNLLPCTWLWKYRVLTPLYL